nr:uncharacterized protein LOC129268058 [Lytechinus pictus]
MPGTNRELWMGCTQCHRQFKTVQDLKDHAERSHPPRQHNCQKCSYTSNRRYDVERHFRNVHGESRRPERDRHTSPERPTPVRAVKSMIVPAPEGTQQGKQKDKKRARSETPLSLNPQSDQELSAGEEYTGPSASLVVDEAKGEVARKALSVQRREKKRGRHYRRVTETVVFPDGRLFRVETEEWN